MLLKTLFHDLVIQFHPTEGQQEHLWQEVEEAYRSPGRHYHTLVHIESVIRELLGVKLRIDNWNTLLFACFYHDIVYDPAKKTNEEESAILAAERMHGLNVTADVIAHCERMIMATQSHQHHPDSDIRYFTDADLAILGADEQAYLAYSEAIRKEYGMFDDETYRKGRTGALEQYLSRPRIYHTDHFYSRYEQKARINMQRETERLQG